MYNSRGLQQYRETDMSSMPREKILVLLYERLIADLQNSITDIERSDKLAMTKNLNHATRIISELRVSLDHDIGGEIATNLDSLYQYTFSQCLEQLLDKDPGHARNSISVLMPLLEAWRKIPIGTGDKAEQERTRGMNPAQVGTKETAAPELSQPETKSFDPNTTVGSLSLSA